MNIQLKYEPRMECTYHRRMEWLRHEEKWAVLQWASCLSAICKLYKFILWGQCFLITWLKNLPHHNFCHSEQNVYKPFLPIFCHSEQNCKCHFCSQHTHDCSLFSGCSLLQKKFLERHYFHFFLGMQNFAIFFFLDMLTFVLFKKMSSSPHMPFQPSVCEPK